MSTGHLLTHIINHHNFLKVEHDTGMTTNNTRITSFTSTTGFNAQYFEALMEWIVTFFKKIGFSFLSATKENPILPKNATDHISGGMVAWHGINKLCHPMPRPSVAWHKKCHMPRGMAWHEIGGIQPYL